MFFVGRLANITILTTISDQLQDHIFPLSSQLITRPDSSFAPKKKHIFYNSQDSLHTKIHRDNRPTFQISNVSLAHFFSAKSETFTPQSVR